MSCFDSRNFITTIVTVAKTVADHQVMQSELKLKLFQNRTKTNRRLEADMCVL